MAICLALFHVLEQMVHRVGTVQDCIETVLFLCSDAASFITAQTINVDGGYSPKF